MPTTFLRCISVVSLLFPLIHPCTMIHKTIFASGPLYHRVYCDITGFYSMTTYVPVWSSLRSFVAVIYKHIFSVTTRCDFLCKISTTNMCNFNYLSWMITTRKYLSSSGILVIIL